MSLPKNTQAEIIDQKKDKKVTLGNIVGAYKSLLMKKLMDEARAVGKVTGTIPFVGKIWQRNYYEHIIRSQMDHDRISL